MPLELLLLLVIGGIAGIALLLHLMGKSTPLAMSPEDARAAWHRHFPDDEIKDALVTNDGRGALIRTPQGPGLVWSLGVDSVARHLRDFDLIQTPEHLTVIFHDFTAPKVTLRLSRAEQKHWLSLMRPT